MNAIEFVAHARTNNFSASQVLAQLPALPLWLCQELINGTAFISAIAPDGCVTVDDGRPDSTAPTKKSV